MSVRTFGLTIAALLCALVVARLDDAPSAAALVGAPASSAAESAASDDPVYAIAAGWYHSCAVEAGGASCWGSNFVGQLGNSSTSDSVLPDSVTGMGSGVSAITGGEYHTCAIQNGAAWCWGQGIGGQLGTGNTSDSSVPISVIGLTSGVQAIAAGYDNSCAVKDGGAWCWGRNGAGQVGDGTTTQSNIPVAVVGLGSGVTGISVGTGFACAVKDGGAWCWGTNTSGQLGNGTASESHVPVAVSGMTNSVTGISAGGHHTCALQQGTVWCWGWNYAGQLGNNSTADSYVPTPTLGLGNDVSSVDVGGDSSCALKGGGAWCWGRNFNGEVGNNSTTDGHVAAVVAKLSSAVVAIGPGASGTGEHTCAIRTSEAWCWGFNSNGQLGDGTVNESHAPVPVGLDTDGDGMPDSYELAHACLDPIAADDDTDTDGGGATNFEEFEFGQDPCTKPQCETSANGLNSCVPIRGDLILVHDPGPVYIAENTLFNGYWSHVAMYLGDGLVAESQSGPPTCNPWWQVWTCLPVTPGVDVHDLVVDADHTRTARSSLWSAADWAILRVDTSPAARNAAAKYAIAQDAKLYNWNFLDKERTDRFYCSQLVWRAYQLQGTDLDSNRSALSTAEKLSWVGPWGIASATGATAAVLAIPPDDLFFSSHIVSKMLRPGILHELRRTVLRIYSPADFYVTDAQGRHTGLDPSTHDAVNEIPGAFYSGSDVDPQFISVTDLVEGWTTDVIGNASGSFTVQGESIEPATHSIDEQTDSTTPGHSSPFTTGYWPPGAVTFTVLPDGDEDGIPDAFEQMHACLNAGADDDDTDADMDGIASVDEYRSSGTDPCNADTDGDSISDGPLPGGAALAAGPDNCPLTPNVGQERTTASADNGPDLPGDDKTIPLSVSRGDACNADADADGLPNVDETSASACGAFDLSTTTRANPAGGDASNDDNRDRNPASPMGSDATDDGPSADTDNDGVLDGAECLLGTNPRDPASLPSATECANAREATPGVGPNTRVTDVDGDGIPAAEENCKWGTSDGFADSDGDGIGDCTEATDIDGNGVSNFPGDSINVAKAAAGLIGKTQDFDWDGNGVVNFPGDAVNSAKRTLRILACS